MDFSTVTLVAHADWSTSPGKRRVAVAKARPGGGYLAGQMITIGDPSPDPVPHGANFIPSTQFLARLHEMAGPGGCVLLGFDFPIGLPVCYAQRVGIKTFLEVLPCFGADEWEHFYKVAYELREISLHRPFYPDKPNNSRRHHLTEALDLDWSHLYRQCERSHPGRRAACPLFWTLGGQQVGKAAIHGWEKIISPALEELDSNLAIWPFSGVLDSLLSPGRIVVTETYPAEFYRPLELDFPRAMAGTKSGKRQQADRRHNAAAMIKKCAEHKIKLEPGLEAQVVDGFGPHAWGEDAFDAFTGMVGMIQALHCWTVANEPRDPRIRQIEGWIFGQPIN